LKSADLYPRRDAGAELLYVANTSKLASQLHLWSAIGLAASLWAAKRLAPGLCIFAAGVTIHVREFSSAPKFIEALYPLIKLCFVGLPTAGVIVID
jgi:hypothetical protein